MCVSVPRWVFLFVFFNKAPPAFSHLYSNVFSWYEAKVSNSHGEKVGFFLISTVFGFKSHLQVNLGTWCKWPNLKMYLNYYYYIWKPRGIY